MFMFKLLKLKTQFPRKTPFKIGVHELLRNYDSRLEVHLIIKPLSKVPYFGLK